MTVRAIVLAAMLASGCATELADTPAAFARDDGARVLCGVGIDGTAISLDAIDAALAQAAERDEVLILFAHGPGTTVAPARISAVLELAVARGLPLRTFPELATSEGRRAGLAFGFDDATVDAWWAMRDVLEDRPVTFFVSNFGELTATQRGYLHALAAEGHAIEGHGMGHRDAAVFADRQGLARYLSLEIDPLLDAMRADGFDPRTFAYPYGSRTRELDEALLARFTLLRSLTYLDASPINTAPCPS